MAERYGEKGGSKELTRRMEKKSIKERERGMREKEGKNDQKEEKKRG